MGELFEAVRFLFLIVFALSSGVIYLLIYNILTERGFKTSGFRTHVNNLLDFSDLVKKTQDQNEKRYYKNLIRAFLVIIVLFLGTALTFIIDIKNISCKAYAEFLIIEVSGRVVDKFEDKPNHNYQTLTIERGDEKINDVLLSLRNTGLFDSVRIGDLVRKVKGDSITYLERVGKGTIQFKINKESFCKN
jgi:hypothetical protein